ncbi:hypothetical protein TYRP_003677 [Tyrophagus putrescentiae]|nr:hypothetical protein TYRP_003677 [Tyrophagus putrescentiae]
MSTFTRVLTTTPSPSPLAAVPSTHPPNLNNHLLWEITGERDDSFFIAQKHRSVLVVDFIRSRLLLVFNGVESAAISTNLLTVGIHFRLGMMLIEEIRGLSFVEQLFYHLIFTLAGALFLFSILTHLYILSLFVSSSKKGLNKKNLNRFCFTFYHRHLVSIFGYFREYNVVYGRLFVVFIFVNAPINVYITSTLVYGNDDVSVIGTAYLLIYAFMQVVGLFVIHLGLVTFSKRIHAPNRHLLQINYRLEEVVSKSGLGTKLKLVNCLVAMSARRPYGITYDRFGLVTLATFARFSAHLRQVYDALV